MITKNKLIFLQNIDLDLYSSKSNNAIYFQEY